MTLFTWGLHSLSGLTRSDELDTHDAIHFVRSKNEIKSVTVGKMITAFLRGDGKLSIIRMQELDDGSTRPGKLSKYTVAYLQANVSTFQIFIVTIIAPLLITLIESCRKLQ